MKLNGHSNTLETNQQGETQNFGIGDVSVVIDILRNRLYEYKVRTLVQEYICNARDANREAGKSDGDFEITVPNALNPVFEVRDFGPGVSPDRMANIFINYGSSTKRGTNNQTGGFGIGAKSAFAYTDSFTITTFIKGVKRVYVAHTGANNNGRLDHVSTDNTNEKDGTKIQVAVQSRDISDFRMSVYRAIHFWTDRPKLRGDVEAPSGHVEGLRLSPVVELVEAKMIPDYVGLSGNERAMAVIDGVPYPISHKLLSSCPSFQKVKNMLTYGRAIVLHFGNGIVEVSASRESIADSPLSVKALERMAAEAYKLATAHVKAKFKAVSSPTEFFTTYKEASHTFNLENEDRKYGDYKINGSVISSELFSRVTITSFHNKARGWRQRTTEKVQKVENYRDINIDMISDMFFLDKAEPVVRLNKRYREYLGVLNVRQLIQIEPKNCVVVTPAVTDKDGKIVTPAVMAPDMVAFQKVVSDFGAKDVLSLTWTEKPKEQRETRVKEKNKFCAHTPSYPSGQRHTYIDPFETDSEWLYVVMKENAWPESYTNEMIRDLSKHFEEHYGKVICGISEKALKNVECNDKFMPLADFLKTWKPKKEEMGNVKYLDAKNTEVMRVLAVLNDVEDKFLDEMITEYKIIEKAAKKKRDDGGFTLPEILINKIKESDDFKEFAKNDKKLEEVLAKKYPLIATINDWRVEKVKDEITLYLNAKHKAA